MASSKAPLSLAMSILILMTIIQSPGAPVENFANPYITQNVSRSLEPIERKDSTSRSLEVIVLWNLSLVSTSKGIIRTVQLEQGAVRAGTQGEEEHYITELIETEGEISNIEMDFLSPVKVHGAPVPYYIEKVLTDGSVELHPRWKGRIEEDLTAKYELTKLTISKISSRPSFSYSLKIMPITYTTGGEATVFERVVVNYSYNFHGPIGPSLSTPRKPMGQVKYLMITHDELKDTVQTLADWKSQKGIFSKVITTSEISSMYKTGDDQAKMRKFIMEMEQQYDLDYLLLAGDWDKVKTRNTKNIYPETFYGEPSTFASDGYYACVDNQTTWDTDGDRAYAEGNEIDDPVPDMAVGRLSINDPQIMRAVIQSLIDREKDPRWTLNNSKTAFFAGDPQNVPGDPTSLMDHFWDIYCDDIFSGRETSYYDGSGTIPFSSSSFIKVAGEGYQAFCYFSHGTQTGLPNLFYNSQVSQLRDVGPDGSMFAMACLTGWFDNPNQGSMGSFTDCFAEAMTETPGKGLVGYIGASRLAVGDIDLTYNGDAPGLEEDYWRGVRMAFMGDIKPTIGDVYREALTHFSANFYPFPSSYIDFAAQRTFLEYNLLGEPEAPLFFHEPGELALEFHLSPDNEWVTASVTDDAGEPVKGATVALYRSGELGVSSITNESGEVNITIPNSNGGIVNITASLVGKIPDQGTFRLPDELDPLPIHSILPASPDGLNGYYVTRPNATFFSDEPVDVELKLDDGAVERINGTAWKLIPEGNHTVHFRVVDGAGRWSEWSDFNVTVDLTAPIMTLLTDPGEPDGTGGVFITQPKVSINSTEALFDVTFEVNGGLSLPYSSPVPIAHGTHSIMFRARDIAGNFNTSSTTLRIDLNLPYSKLTTSNPPDGDSGYYRTAPQIFLEGFDENDAGVTYRWDDMEWLEYSVPLEPPKGIHQLSYRAFDTSGNMEAEVNYEWFRFDPDPPVISMEVTPAEPDGLSGFYRVRPSIEIDLMDDVSNGSVQMFYVLSPPGEGFDWGNDSIPAQGAIEVPEGDWMFYLMARDPAGNRANHYPVHFKVDLTAPILVLNLTPMSPDGENGFYISRPMLRVDWLSPDANAYLSYDDEDLWTPLNDTFELKEGSHKVVIRTLDEAGNEGTSQTLAYKCDLRMPQPILIVRNSTRLAGDPFFLNASASFDENGIVSYRYHSNDGKSTLWTEQADWDFVFEEEGEYSIWVDVKDPAGHVNSSMRAHVRVLPRPEEPDDNDTPQPPGPGPDENATIGDDAPDYPLLIKVGIAIILAILTLIFLGLYIRKRTIKEVEWEDEEDWENEDWVDADLDEDGPDEQDEFSYE